MNPLSNRLIFCFLLLVSATGHALETGTPPPNCLATLANGEKNLDLGEFKGRVILIDFWATWCPPCKKSMPFLNSLRNKHQKEGFEIVAINVDEDTQTAKEFLKSNPVDYALAFDAKGDCPSVFDVKAMPSSYLVDKTGTIRLVHLGFRDGDEQIIRENVEKLLNEWAKTQ